MATGGLPRTIAALLFAGALAPVLFVMLGLLSARSFGSMNELVGLGLIALVLGGPASVCTALIAGLPGIYLARRLHLTSPWIFGIAGALLALGCTAWFAREDVASPPLTDWTGFGTLAALTGALCGMLCWLIAERPRRIEKGLPLTPT